MSPSSYRNILVPKAASINGEYDTMVDGCPPPSKDSLSTTRTPHTQMVGVLFHALLIVLYRVPVVV